MHNKFSIIYNDNFVIKHEYEIHFDLKKDVQIILTLNINIRLI